MTSVKDDHTQDGTSPRTMIFKASFHRKRKGCSVSLLRGPPPKQSPPVRRPARVAITLALAHKIEQAIRQGKLKDRADAAQRLGFSRARITQICNLTLLPVAEQERILFLEAVDGKEPFGEHALRA